MHALYQALRTVRDDWGLTDDQLAELAHVTPARLREWSELPGAAPPLPAGMETALPIIAIHRRLRERLPDPERQLKWLTTAHPDLQGHTPLQIARTSAENLTWLAYFLESALTLGAP